MKKTAPLSQDTPYTYTGDGLCIPGLPAICTYAQAQELDLLETFQAAIENGSYQPQEPSAPEIPQQEP